MTGNCSATCVCVSRVSEAARLEVDGSRNVPSYLRILSAVLGEAQAQGDGGR